MASLTVWPDRFGKGWNGEDWELEELEGFPSVPVWDALVKRYETDAHCVCYTVPGEESIPRINKRALKKCQEEGLALRFEVLLVDVDGPKRGLPDGWRSKQVAKLQGSPLAVTPPGVGGWYGTRGGLRLVYLLPEPLGPASFEHFVAHLLVELDRLGVAADKACKDWTRCYRLPRVLRDGEPQAFKLSLPSSPLTWTPPKGRTLPRKLSNVPAPVRDVLTEGTTINEGGRNAALTRIAGSLRGRGLSEAALLAALREENERICDPPLEESEVERIASSVGRYAPEEAKQLHVRADGTEAPRVLLGSENELADLVLKALEEGQEQTVHDRGLLWRYEPALGIWEEVPEHVPQAILEGYDGASYGQSSKVRVSSRMVGGVLRLIAGKRSRPGYFDNAPPGVCCSNGRAVVCDCEDGCEECDGSGIALLDHDPGARSTFALPVPYDPKVRSLRWHRFLEEVFEGAPDADERRALLQEFVGSCLIGYASRLQKALLLVGEGANGKSTFLDVISALFPDEARASVPPQHMDHDYRRDLLSKARINIVSEVPEADIASAEAFRAIVDGSEITARCIYQRPYRFRPQAGHLLACNSLPGVRDFSHAFWRRWLAIAFDRIFKPEEQEPGLSRKLIKEELVGVVAWALAGAVRVKRSETYTVPCSSVLVAEKWRRQADQVAAFVADELVKPEKPSQWTRSTEIYRAYVRWCQRNGQRFQVSNRKLTERLKLLRVGGDRIVKDKRRDANYLSVRLKPGREH